VAEEAIRIFISYSHNDLEMLTELNKHLAVLKRTNHITTWDDRQLKAGSEWEPDIQHQLNMAEIIILLISANFIASDYCFYKELQRAIERHDAGEACVIPVILEPCLWNDADIPFSKLNVLPTNARAITQWENQAEAFTNVAEKILNTVVILRDRKLENLSAVDSASNILNKHPSAINSPDVKQVRIHFGQKVLEKNNRSISSEVRSLIKKILNVSALLNRGMSAFDVDQQSDEFKTRLTPDIRNTSVPTPDFSSKTVIDDSTIPQRERKIFHKVEIFSFLYIFNQQITHQIKILIEPIQEYCCQRIQNQYSQIRLLSGEDIGVDQLYVDVWLLGRPESHYFNTAESLLRNFDIEQDRLALSKRIQRNPGFKIANNNPKLIILGKPGSGKTTFLKHLAVDWCKGKFQPEQIAVLIELRQIQKKGKSQKWNLVAAIGQELELEREVVLGLLEHGKLLMLLDGLDEIPTDELRRNVQSQIEQISKKYSDENRFILTCRTQIMEVIPSSFASVEVADFNSEQIEQFVLNWFTANGQSTVEVAKQWQLMRRAINSQPDLREVTATPVLLSLICVVWQDSGEIPTNRTNLYKRGISWLLKRWNDEKKIEGWELGTEAYRKLSVKEKQELLTEIAAHKFDNPKNFVLFEQDELIEQISQRLQLANAQEGLAVLKAIEAQHGLLIERADELWSFSHLTFQEFFTVQWLTQLTPQQLTEKIANQQWQQAIEQLVKSQQPADRLLRLIKQAIDRLIAQESDIQTFFDWLLHKSISFESNYEPVAVRAFYYSLTFDLELDLNPEPTLDFTLPRDIVLNLALYRDNTLYTLYTPYSDRDNTLYSDSDNTPYSDNTLYNDSDNTINLDLVLDLALDRALDLALDSDLDSASVHTHIRVLTRTLDRALDLALNSNKKNVRILNRTLVRVLNRSHDLSAHLNQLKKELPTSAHSEGIQRWWLLDRAQWSEQLRQVMVEHRNIGHDWQFTQKQQNQLQLYYEANKFLIGLINIKGAVNETCHIELENGLLLPWEELQRRQPHIYEDMKTWKT